MNTYSVEIWQKTIDCSIVLRRPLVDKKLVSKFKEFHGWRYLKAFDVLSDFGLIRLANRHRLLVERAEDMRPAHKSHKLTDARIFECRHEAICNCIGSKKARISKEYNITIFKAYICTHLEGVLFEVIYLIRETGPLVEMYARHILRVRDVRVTFKTKTYFKFYRRFIKKKKKTF